VKIKLYSFSFKIQKFESFLLQAFKKNVPVNLFKVKIGDTDLECVKHMKYLGVVIDNNLKYGNNIWKCCRKK
jgi:hypothetical protein